MSATDAAVPDAKDIRPLVANAQSRRGLFLFAALLAALGGGLFAALETRRAAVTSPSVIVPQNSQQGMIGSPPDLVIPAPYTGYDTRHLPRAFPPENSSPLSRSAPQASPPARAERYAVAATPPERDSPSISYPVPQPETSSPNFSYPGSTLPSPRNNEDNAGEPVGRARASFMRNPATTVPQGTVVQAVLETALDSTRPGFARALVIRDVRGFDGSKVLIPRGSRLFGEYASDLSLGQKRAHIQWRRLTRPDGAIIDLNSPSADPLGRAGIKGKVNSHFFQRFSGAILQSVLDIGVGVATREVAGNNNVVLALPNSTQNLQIDKPEDIKPTLKVRQGKSVSVMVARDLDFTDVES